MMYFDKYTPAEIMLLTEKNKIEYENAVKYTFLDLVSKKVLQTTYEKKESRSESKPRYYRYVSAGPQFYSYLLQPHEGSVVLDQWFSSGSRILFQHYIKMVFDKIDSKKTFSTKILESGNMRSLAGKNFWQIIFGGFTLSKVGKQITEEILKEKTKLKSEIEHLLTYNVSLANQRISEIKGNVFLLGLDFARLKNPELIVLSDINKFFIKMDSSTGGGSSCYGCTYFVGCGGTGCSGCGGSGCGGCGS